MAGTHGETAGEPLVQPRLVRFLKDRPRVVDKGVRRDFLEQLDRNMCQRRCPDHLAEKAVRDFFERMEESGGEVARDRVKRRLDNANNGPLQNL